MTVACMRRRNISEQGKMRGGAGRTRVLAASSAFRVAGHPVGVLRGRAPVPDEQDGRSIAPKRVAGFTVCAHAHLYYWRAVDAVQLV
jgi:hypothetical protein